MSKSTKKLVRLLALAGGTLVAISGCAGGNWLPLLVGAGFVATLLNQQQAG